MLLVFMLQLFKTRPIFGRSLFFRLPALLNAKS